MNLPAISQRAPATQVVVDPLPPSFGDGASNYIVLNRPYAFMEWWVQKLRDAQLIHALLALCAPVSDIVPNARCPPS